MLIDSAAGTEHDIAGAREEAHGLGLVARSLVGLDREAATGAFDRCLGDASFSANQIRFVQPIVEHLTAAAPVLPRRGQVGATAMVLTGSGRS